MLWAPCCVVGNCCWKKSDDYYNAFTLLFVIVCLLLLYWITINIQKKKCTFQHCILYRCLHRTWDTPHAPGAQRKKKKKYTTRHNL